MLFIFVYCIVYVKGSVNIRKIFRLRRRKLCNKRIKTRIEIINTDLRIVLYIELDGYKALFGFESISLDYIENIAGGNCQNKEIPL